MFYHTPSVFVLGCLIATLLSLKGFSQSPIPDAYNPVWTTQSPNSAASMPCGGGDIGLNVWVENGDVLFYFSRSGTFDENNMMLKGGRVRLQLSPNPLAGIDFSQALILEDGYIKIQGSHEGYDATVTIWVDVFHPAMHVNITANRPVQARAQYESWRYQDRVLTGKANNANSYKWAPQGEVKTKADAIAFDDHHVLFYHRNQQETVFDVVVKQQGLDAVKSQLFNPLENLTFGGVMTSPTLTPAGTQDGRYLDTDFRSWALASPKASRHHQVDLYLHTAQASSLADWKAGLTQTMATASPALKKQWRHTQAWWHAFWQRSFIYIQPNNPQPNAGPWQAGRNYQLFRYMLGCNAYGAYPTKFNGGLFTYDPVLTDSTLTFTPDHRNWGGGTMTAQNQRLVYFPMIKSGDFDMMPAQFKYYLQILHNAELRSQVYWQHAGACFTEQLENFGLPNPAEYGWNRPPYADPGVEYNAWLEYEWDTVLEFCLMMLETERYADWDVTPYLPFIESCLTFFDEHYQYLARHRGRKPLDEDGHLVLYPGSACETYKMAYNATSTIAALQTILSRLLALPPRYGTTEQRAYWQSMLTRIPPISFRTCEGHTTIAPAKLWERVNNVESPQLYPVFPWGQYGVGQPNLEVARNTYYYDPDVVKFKSHTGWKQHNIFAARLGLTEEAATLTVAKLQNAPRRFPAFWGPGYDWTPDHNWGGSGMIGLQEMLLQADDQKIYLFPAWPKAWDVHFKLHAPYQTTVEGILKNGKLNMLKVAPPERKADIINMLTAP